MVVTLLILIAVILLFGGIAVRNALGTLLITIASFCAVCATVIWMNYIFGGNAGLYAIFAFAGALMVWGFLQPSPKEIEAKLAADRVCRAERPSAWPSPSSPPGGERSTTPRPRR